MRIAALVLVVVSTLLSAQQSPPHTITLPKQKQITLSLPQGLTIELAATGLHCPRFFAVSPDHRVFVADLHDRSDNTKGGLYILDGWSAQTHTFARIIPYLENLRNPNNLAFTPNRPSPEDRLKPGSTPRLPIGCSAFVTVRATLTQPPIRRSLLAFPTTVSATNTVVGILPAR